MIRSAAALMIVAVGWLAVGPARANHVPRGAYSGTHAGGGMVDLRLSDDGAAVTSFVVTGGLGGSCPAAFGISPPDLRIVDHAFALPPETVPFFGTISLAGSFPTPGRAVGTMTLSCAGGATIGWAATLVSPPSPPPAPPPPPVSPPPPPPAPVVAGPYFLGGHDRVTIVQGKPGAYDESVRAKFRVCSGRAPFRLYVTQRRRVGGAVVAKSNFSRPLTGAKTAPPTASGITCRDYVVSWPVARKLYGTGWLTITLRIVDARGNDSGAPNFALRAPKP